MGVVPFLPDAAGAVIPFTAEGPVILSSVTSQDVEAVAGGFRMYVASNNFVILSATSTDQASWSIQNGIRISTGVGGADSSSITSCGITYITSNTADGYRMYYSAIGNTGLYSILSATSTDGLTWSKEAGIRFQLNGGAAFLDSPRPLRVSATLTRLFFVADNAGGNNPANYRIFSASSPNQGTAFFNEGAVLPADQAFQVSVTTLTDGRTRLYYTALNGGAVPAQVLSAISSNGISFAKEAGVRLSTAAATALTYPVVVRSTETYRWRMFESYAPSGPASRVVSRALTLTPVPLSSSPGTVLVNQNNVAMAIGGEIFSPLPTASYVQGINTIPVGALVRVNDLSITGNINPFNQSTGRYGLTVTNADLANGTLPNALLVDTPPGTLSLVGNLFRPLLGQVCTLTVQIFAAGDVSLKLFTMAGGLVNTLFDGPLPSGTKTFTWNGRTGQGNVVASGVYVVRATGPKLDDTQKIVVIK